MWCQLPNLVFGFVLVKCKLGTESRKVAVHRTWEDDVTAARPPNAAPASPLSFIGFTLDLIQSFDCIWLHWAPSLHSPIQWTGESASTAELVWWCG